MNVNKEAGVDCGLELSPEEMERINAMSKKKLEPGEVYAFAVRLCDNEIDRDRPPPWRSWPPCLWAGAVCLTTSGAPGTRRPASTEPRWCGRAG